MHRLLCTTLVVLLAPGVLGAGLASSAAAESLAVIDFADGTSTRQQGFVFAAGAKPVALVDEYVEAGTPTAACWRVSVTDAAPGGEVAAIIPVYDNRSGVRDRKLLDASSARYLRVRILGELGERTVSCVLVPGVAQTPDRAGMKVGRIDAKQLDGSKWTTLTFAVDDAREALGELGGIQLRLDGTGDAWFAVAAVWFSDAPNEPAAVAANAASEHPLKVAMWVWFTREICADADERKQLVAFAKKHGVTDLYCQIPYTYEAGKVQLEQVDDFRAMNAAASAAGLTVHALDGHPKYVLAESHPRMLAFIEAIATFNEAAPEAERYRAIHLDNEPYVLPEWRDDAKRRGILQDYITLNRKLREATRQAGLEYGVDIPFWWDDVTSEGEARFTVSSAEGTKPLLDALFETVDNVGIMSYRERVTGPNGVLGCAGTEFELGAKYGVEVLSAVELKDDVEPGITFGVYPIEYFRGQWSTLRRALARTPGCAGAAIHYYRHFRNWEQESRS